MRLYHESYGAGEPLIILHGLFGSLDNWRTMGRKFGRHYRVYTVDLRNHGRSPHSDEFTYPLMAADLKEFLDEHGLRSACLLGHSMGGKVAMQFALTFPDLVEKLVVADIAPKEYQPQHGTIVQTLSSLDPQQFSSRQEIDETLREPIPDPALRQFLLKNLVRDASGLLRWRINLDAIARHLGEVSKGVHAGHLFAKPTLFLKGGKSPYIQPEDAASIRELFPLAEIVAIAGAGHWLQADAPEEFYRTVLAFLQSSRLSAGNF